MTMSVEFGATISVAEPMVWCAIKSGIPPLECIITQRCIQAGLASSTLGQLQYNAGQLPVYRLGYLIADNSPRGPGDTTAIGGVGWSRKDIFV